MKRFYQIELSEKEVKALISGLYLIGNYEYENEMDEEDRVGMICDEIEEKLIAILKEGRK